MEDIRVLVFFYIFEGMLVSFVGLGLIGIRLKWQKYVVIGVLQGTLVYFVRGIYNIMEIPLGTHVLIALSSLIIILRFIGRVKWVGSFAAALLAFLILSFSEALTFPFLLSKQSLTIEMVMKDTWLHIMFGYMGDALLILITFILLLTKKSLIDLEKLKI